MTKRRWLSVDVLAAKSRAPAGPKAEKTPDPVAVKGGSREPSGSPLWNQLATGPPPTLTVGAPHDGDTAAGAVVPPVVHEALGASGRPLDPATRDYFEPRFGVDFGEVRVHTGAGAAASARALAARAFTVGRDIVFGDGQYAPHTAGGRRLLAHELTHTAQHAADSAGGGVLPIMRQPLPGEDAAAHKERQEVLDDVKATIKNLEQCLAKKAPCHPDETIASSGDVRFEGWPTQPLVETKATHSGRLTQLVADLKDIQQQLDSTRIAAGALASVVYDVTPRGPRHYFGGYPASNFYVRHALKQGRTYTIAINNALYIEHIIEKKRQPTPAPAKKKTQPPPQPPDKTVTQPKPKPKPSETKASEPPVHFEENTGYMLVVPDPKNAPHVYHALTKYGDNRGHILNIWRDEHGYYYGGPGNKKVRMPNWQHHPEGL